MSENKSEIIVKTTLSESFILEDIDMREISIYKKGISKNLFMKFDGMNNKSHQKDQIQIILKKSDAEDLCRGINEVIKNGLFEVEES